jgi:hypothetical protein
VRSRAPELAELFDVLVAATARLAAQNELAQNRRPQDPVGSAEPPTSGNDPTAPDPIQESNTT